MMNKNPRNQTNVRPTKTKILVVLSLVLVSISGLVTVAEGAGGSLSIFPQSGSFTVGNNFEVSIFMNTGGNDVNAVQVDLKFDPEKIQVITPAKGISVVEEWIFPPSFSNSQGTVSLLGGFLGKGINTTEGLVTIIVFEAISAGRVTVDFLDSSKILVGKEEGADILSSVNRGVYEILPPPFKGPRIFSETHPDQNRWYKNNNPTFSWEKIEEATGFSYKLDDDPYGEPDNNIDTQQTFVSFENVKNGVLYFHLKAKKGGIWGGTSHFKVMIDADPPLEFKPYLESLAFGAGDYLLIYFSTKDLLSGIGHYHAKITDITDPENIVFSGWTREESPFRLTTERRGIFEVTIRAFDRAGNFQEGKIKLRIINSFLVLTSSGIKIRGIFLPWWQIFLLVLVIFLGIGFLIFKLIREKREGIRIKLEKEIKEAEKEIEDVRKAEERFRRLRIEEERAGKEWKRLKEELEEETK